MLCFRSSLRALFLFLGLAAVPCVGLQRPPSQGLVFNFDADPTGQPPAGWLEVNSDVSLGLNWLVLAHPPAPSPPNVLVETTFTPDSGRIPKLIWQGHRFLDGEIGVQVKHMGPRSARTAGLVWRYQNENNYFFVGVSATGHLTELQRVRNGRRTTIPARRTGQAPLLTWEGWTVVRVSFDGPNIVAFVNDVKALEARDSILGWPGRVGLWSAGPGITNFDDFTIAIKK